MAKNGKFLKKRSNLEHVGTPEDTRSSQNSTEKNSTSTGSPDLKKRMPTFEACLKGVLLLAGLALFVGMAVLTSCSPTGQVKYGGASTLLLSINRLGTAFHESNPQIKIFISGGGTSHGLRALKQSSVDMAGMARDPNDDEKKEFWIRPIAKDAIAIIVNQNTVIPNSITLEELRNIYTQDMSPLKLYRIAKSSSHGTSQAFSKGLNTPLSDIRREADGQSNGHVLSMVGKQFNSIGFVSSVDAYAAIEAGESIKIVNIDGVAPTLENVESGRYALVRRLYLAVRKFDKAELQFKKSVTSLHRFLDFVQSSRGHEILRASGLVPISRGEKQ